MHQSNCFNFMFHCNSQIINQDIRTLKRMTAAPQTTLADKLTYCKNPVVGRAKRRDFFQLFFINNTVNFWDRNSGGDLCFFPLILVGITNPKPSSMKYKTFRIMLSQFTNKNQDDTNSRKLRKQLYKEIQMKPANKYTARAYKHNTQLVAVIGKTTMSVKYL